MTAFLAPALSSAPRMVGPTAPAATAAALAVLINVRREALPESLEVVSRSDMGRAPLSSRAGNNEQPHSTRDPPPFKAHGASRSHALRGNARSDALRRINRRRILSRISGGFTDDAERR